MTSDLDRSDEIPSVSVVIAAFDMARWRLLERAIRSASTQASRPEVILAVDNNSELYERAREAFTDVRVVLNSGGRGASVTRNVGAAAASAEILAFLDDDAEAAPGWLEHLARPLVDDATVVGVGGGVTPDWPSSAPRWFPMEFAWVVGATYIGMPTFPSPVRNVWSENMAVRAGDFRRVGGFREGFGKVGTASRPEDTEFCVRIQSEFPGTTWWYVPDALISHHVSPERASVRFFMRRCLAEGRGKAGLATYVGQTKALATERSYVARHLTAGVARGFGEALRGDGSGLLRAGAIVLGGGLAALGYVAEVAAIRAGRRRADPVAAGA